MPPDQMSRTARIVLPFVGVAVVLIAQVAQPASAFDDAFITFRYARNIANGAGFVYNPGQPVLGTTSPLFTLLLAISGAVAGDAFIPQAAFLTALLADCASAWLIFHLSKAAFTDERIGLFVTLAFALSPFRLSVARGGMEASVINLLLLLAFERLMLARRLVSGTVFACLALLTRPDAVVALVPLYAVLFLQDRRFSLRSAALLSALVLPWILWATAYFGTPVPLSITAKASAYRYLPGFAAYFITSFLGTGTLGQFPITAALLGVALLSLVVLLCGVFNMVRQRVEFSGLVGYPPLFLLAMTLVNAPMFFPWYFYPLLPGLLFSLVAFVWFLPGPRIFRTSAVGFSLLLVTLVPAYWIATQPSWPLSREREAAYQLACEELAAQVDPNDVVLAPDIGVVGWCLEGTEILDPIGLVSPNALPYFEPRPQGPAIPLDLVQDMQPEYIVTLEQYLKPTLSASEDFVQAYRVVWSTPVSIAGQAQPLQIFRRFIIR